MSEVHLSKSKYCRAVQCNKMLWLDKNMPEEKSEIDGQAVLETGIKVGELAKGIFGEYTDIEYNENLFKMICDTQEALKKSPNIITEASFNYQNNFCSVDILKNNKDGMEIYEVKSSTEVKDIYIDDISYQFYILSNLGYKVNKASVVYINNQYIRHGELDLSKLFNIEDVTEIVYSKQDEIKNKIIEIEEYMNYGSQMLYEPGSVMKSFIYAAAMQDYVKQADALLVFVSNNKNHEYGAMHAGSAYQNVGLYAASVGLNNVVLGSIDKDLLHKELNLKDDEYVVIAQALGWPKAK